MVTLSVAANGVMNFLHPNINPHESRREMNEKGHTHAGKFFAIKAFNDYSAKTEGL
jgi:hypothetical protein